LAAAAKQREPASPQGGRAAAAFYDVKRMTASLAAALRAPARRRAALEENDLE